MNSAIINIKTDPKLKEEAQKTAEQLGFSLSSILNAYLRQFIRTRTVAFSLHNEIPNAQTIADLRQSEEDVKAGRVISFKSGKDALQYLSDEINHEKRTTR